MFSRPVDPQPFQNSLDDWENNLLARLDQRLSLLSNAPGSAAQSGLQPDGYSALRYGMFSPPDNQGYIASAKRRLYVAQAGALIVGTTPVTATISLTDTLQQDDGLLLEWLGGQVDIAAGAGATVTVRDLLLGLNAASGGTIIPLGTPTLTTLQPLLTTTLNFPNVPMLTARDLDFFARAIGVAGGLFAPTAQPLKIALTINFNDTVAASNATIRLFAMYRVINGLTGA
jgi:hypothetical protein